MTTHSTLTSTAHEKILKKLIANEKVLSTQPVLPLKLTTSVYSAYNALPYRGHEKPISSKA
jgi:hypothetical protein